MQPRYKEEGYSKCVFMSVAKETVSYLLFALILIKGIIWDMYNTAEMEPVLNSRFWSLGFIFISGYTTYFYFKNVQMDTVEKGIISLTYYTSLNISIYY